MQKLKFPKEVLAITECFFLGQILLLGVRRLKKKGGKSSKGCSFLFFPFY